MTDTATLAALYRTEDPYDAWGNCMTWLFMIADSLHFHHAEPTPGEWEYRPGMGRGDDADDHIPSVLDDTPPDTLIEFGNKLIRLRGILVALGRDY